MGSQVSRRLQLGCHRVRPVLELLILVLSSALAGAPRTGLAQPGPTRPAIVWDFSTPGDSEGWGASHCLSDPVVAGGYLTTEIRCDDPYIFGPPMTGPDSVAADDNSYVLLRLRLTGIEPTTTKGAIYFRSSVCPTFSESTQVDVPLINDGAFHTYAVFMKACPCWSGTIRQIRLDPSSADSTGRMELDYAAIAPNWWHGSWDFTTTGYLEGWQAGSGLSPPVVSGGLLSTSRSGSGEEAWLTSRGLDVDTGSLASLQVRMRLNSSDGGNHEGMVYFTTTQDEVWNEAKSVRFPLASDRDFHTYKIPLGGHALWSGSAVQVRIAPLGDPAVPAEVELDYINFGLRWEFDHPGDSEGWTAEQGMDRLQVGAGTLYGRMTGPDPIISTLWPGAAVDSSPYLVIRMRLDETGGCGPSIYFSTDLDPMSEATRVSWPGICDRAYHTYVVRMADNPRWRGHLTKLRLDPKWAVPQGEESWFNLESIRLLAGTEPGLVLSRFRGDQEPVYVGQEFQLTLRVRNDGTALAEQVRATIHLPEGLRLLPPDLPTIEVGTVAPFDSTEVFWRVAADSCGSHPAGVSVFSNNVVLEAADTLSAFPGIPALASDAPSEARAYASASGTAVLENQNLRLAFVRDCNQRFASALFYLYKDGGWARVGSCSPLGSLTGQLNTTDSLFRATVEADSLDILVAGGDSAQIVLRGKVLDADGVSWNCAFDFRVSSAAPIIRVTNTCQVSSARNVLAFAGPTLKAGEGSFGEAKDAGLFPGLEWLTADESSSNTLDDHGPSHLRLVPHPNKITMPLMAVCGGGLVTGLFWDPRQIWNGVQDTSRSERRPAALYASPNWLQNQDNHLMGVFLPSMPDFLEENKLEATAPYTLDPNDELKISAELFARPATDILSAVDLWWERHGTPTLPSWPRTEDEEQALCEDALLHTLWRPDRRGWVPYAEDPYHLDPAPYPRYSSLLWNASLQTGDPVRKTLLRDRVAEAVDEALLRWGEGGLAEGGGTTPGVELPFFVGHIDATLGSVSSSCQSLVQSQLPDGGWPFRGDPLLGMPGSVELGTCAWATRVVLQGALLLGDSVPTAAGERALERMNAFTVPRGAQTWEIPVHTPDMLAAAHAVVAYLDGYRLTQKAEYLDRARYWARAGLPFLYHWDAPDRSPMRYGSIPVFGSTWYTYPWFGRPVQWCGLVLADAYFRLAEYDSTRPWGTIGDGLVICGTQMQNTVDEHRYGCYPDAWDLMSGQAASPLNLSPDAIFLNLRPRPGLPVTPRTSVLQIGSARVGITAHASVSELVYLDHARTLTFHLAYPAGETSRVVLWGLDRPDSVWKDELPLMATDDLDSVPEGWQFVTLGPSSAQVLIKVVHQNPASSDSTVIHQIVLRASTTTAGAPRSAGAIPDRFALSAPRPNPSSTTVAVILSLPTQTKVRVDVYNVTGARVATPVAKTLPAGDHRIVWNGMDLRGHSCSSGVYWIRAQAGTSNDVRRCVVLR